jgi:hypothetical protein
VSAGSVTNASAVVCGGLTYRFGDHVAVDDVDLQIRHWLQAISKVNPLTYEVEALRALLVGTSTNLWLDLGVLGAATLTGITASSMLLPRLAR